MTDFDFKNFSSNKAIYDIRFSNLHYPTMTVSGELNLYEVLNEGALSLSNLAKELHISLASCEALTRVLWALNLIEKKDGIFCLTDLSRAYLLKSSPISWTGIFQKSSSNPLHAKILEAIQKEGKSLVVSDKNMTDMWSQDDLDPETAQFFTQRMHEYIFSSALIAAPLPVFKKVHKLLDVGGGSGAFCIALAREYENFNGTVFDLSAVCDVAQKFIEQYNLSSRLNTFSGNFFKDDFPEGYDTILFSNIFHDWRSKTCEMLVQKSFNALSSGGKICIHEMIWDDEKGQDLAAACFSMSMFINHGSRQYTRDELFHMFQKSGFVDPEIHETPGYYSLVCATKP